MKKLLMFLSLVTGPAIMKAQAARINVFEKKGSENIPVAGIKFEITFSDTIITEMTSSSTGLLGKFPLSKGSYSVKLSSAEYKDAKGQIMIEDKKTSTLDLYCTRKEN